MTLEKYTDASWYTIKHENATNKQGSTGETELSPHSGDLLAMHSMMAIQRT
jgi:hypothetical protein